MSTGTDSPRRQAQGRANADHEAAIRNTADIRTAGLRFNLQAAIHRHRRQSPDPLRNLRRHDYRDTQNPTRLSNFQNVTAGTLHGRRHRLILEAQYDYGSMGSYDLAEFMIQANLIRLDHPIDGQTVDVSGLDGALRLVFTAPINGVRIRRERAGRQVRIRRLLTHHRSEINNSPHPSHRGRILGIGRTALSQSQNSQCQSRGAKTSE